MDEPACIYWVIENNFNHIIGCTLPDSLVIRATHNTQFSVLGQGPDQSHKKMTTKSEIDELIGTIKEDMESVDGHLDKLDELRHKIEKVCFEMRKRICRVDDTLRKIDKLQGDKKE